MSTGEAEFYGVVEASGIGLGSQDLLGDLRRNVSFRVWTYSDATTGICGRSGPGNPRQIDTRAMWIQQRLEDSSLN